MNAAEERFQAEAGRLPSTLELARRMNMPVSKFTRMKRTVSASHSVPLEPGSDRNDDSRIGALIPVDPGPGPTDQTERDLIREYITRGLKEQDRLILTLYYYEKLTMSATRKLSISSRPASQIRRVTWWPEPSIASLSLPPPLTGERTKVRSPVLLVGPATPCTLSESRSDWSAFH
jgi:DNA-directed RNA polymerase specialized sigma subunit